MPDQGSRSLAILLALSGLSVALAQPSPALAQLFYCPERPIDQQYVAEPAPGCVPLVDEEERRSRRDDARPRSEPVAPVDLADLQGTVVRFLERYNEFVACCAADSNQVQQAEDLSDDADRLLETAQRGMSSALLQARGMTLRELMHPVTRASRDLKELALRLERLQVLEAQRFASDYETAGRLRRAIAEEKDALRQRFQPLRLPESGRTGTGIQDTSVPARVGGADESSLPAASGRAPGSPAEGPDSLGSRSGAGIGDTGSSGSRVGQTPVTGFGIGGGTGPTGESSLPTRAGPSIGE